MFIHLNRFTTASARGLFHYDLNDRTRNNEAKLILKYFNTSVAQHFYPIKITTTWNAVPNEVVTSRTVNSFKNTWTYTGQKIPQMSELTGSNHRCRAQFKCMCTNSRRPVFCWKWTQRSILRLLLLHSISRSPLKLCIILANTHLN